MKAFFRRTMTGLISESDDGNAILRGIKIGQSVMVEVTKPRNIQHHRLYWALVAKIARSIDVEPDNVSDVLKLRTGHFSTVNTKSGPVQLPRSISFASMDQAAFTGFFERCCNVIATEWLPHMTAGQVQVEVLDMMGMGAEEKK